MGKNNKFSLTTKSHSSTRVNPYDKITMNALNISCPDKSIVLPKLDSNGAQLFSIELYSLFIFIIALGTQYLNLYRSVWWLSSSASSSSSTASGVGALFRMIHGNSNHPPPPPPPSASHAPHHQPDSHAHHHHHLHLDYDVSEFSLLFIGQSSLISILRMLFNGTTIPAKYLQNPLAIQATNSNGTTTTSTHNNNQQHLTSPDHNSSQTNSKTTSQQQQNTQNCTNLATVVTAIASWICNYYLFKCAYRIWNNFGFNGLSCVSYPIIISFILNSTHIIQVFESCRKTGKLNLSFLTLSMTIFSFHIKFDDDKLCHSCSNQPDEIRDEVERLRTIFNDRLKFVLYKSILLAYYSSFVPICFAQSFLYYDYTWTAQHVAITWISSLIMLISSSYTPHFYDVLHRSAYHFGKWQRLEARNTLMPCINWSENVIYPQGVVVKHYRGYFRSESVSNCAQPGVSSHLRYYIVFSNPKIGYAAALALLGLLLVVQMYLLLVSTEWYKLIAMTNMMLINFHSIFRLVKSLVVITKIYKGKH